MASPASALPRCSVTASVSVTNEEVIVSAAKSHVSFDRSQVDAVRRAWVAAALESNVNHLATLVTDDVVVVFGNGYCACGKEDLKNAFLHAFEKCDVERTVLSSEVVFHNHWAIEIDDVQTTRSAIGSDDAPVETQFNDVFVFRQQADASWKIARIVELRG